MYISIYIYMYDSNIYDNSPTQQLGIVTLTNHHSSGATQCGRHFQPWDDPICT